MYKVGEWVYDFQTREKVQILDANEVWGFKNYRVFNPDTQCTYQLPEEQVATIDTPFTYNQYFIQYISLLCKIKNETNEGLLSHLSSGIIPLPHQLYALNRVVSTNTIRYILADEVGLGKTIEAGLIIKELKARGLIKRILVVCPKGLVTQWELEMKEKFDEHFDIVLPEDYGTLKRFTSQSNVYQAFDQIISPMDSIKPLERRAGWNEERVAAYNEQRIESIINSGWDLIIIDEAHRVAGSSGEVARYKLGHLLCSAAPYVLLLTATPHCGKTESFLRLVRLLDDKAFPNYKAIVKEQVAPYIIRSEKREAIDNNGNKLFKNRLTKVVEISWDERHTLQRKLYELVTEYVCTGYNQAIKEKKFYIGFLMILMQRLVTSSTAAIRDSIEKRLNVLINQEMKVHHLTVEELAEESTEESLEKAIEVISLNIKKEIKQLEEILAVAKQAEFEYLDAKSEPLIQILDTLYAEDPNRKTIIFTEFVATQDYLVSYLTSKGFKCSKLNGSMDIEERNNVLQEFKTSTNVLISSDAGGEGLNLQFANILINYDLPWNPMKIEQRIGRIDRIGQKDVIHIFNFIIKDTIENRVRTVLEDKLHIIFKEMGIDKLSDVLDQELAEVDFTNLYVKSIRNPKNIEYNVTKMEDDIKSQIKSAQDVKQLLTIEKNLTISQIEDNGFDVEHALGQMIRYYYAWKNKDITLLQYVHSSDDEVKKHLVKDLYFSSEEPLLHIEIKDFPNEKGYFMLWELSINDTKGCKRVIPLFINEEMVLRPLAGKKIWEELTKEKTQLIFKDSRSTDLNLIEQLTHIAQNYAYDTFIELKERYEAQTEEKHRKYTYAIKLRKDAAEKIGIENIRHHRLKQLDVEKQAIDEEYEKSKQICPLFKPIIIVYVE